MTNTEFPTCPQCLQFRIEEWELIFDAEGKARVECECCGAVYHIARISVGGAITYSNLLMHPGKP